MSWTAVDFLDLGLLGCHALIFARLCPRLCQLYRFVNWVAQRRRSRDSRSEWWRGALDAEVGMGIYIRDVIKRLS